MDKEKVRVLVVDDDPASVELVSKFVTAWEFEPVQALHPHAALHLASQQEIHLAVIDLHLPEMDGAELMESLRARNCAMEVVLITADYSVELAVDAIKRGAYDYLCKPIDFDQLGHGLNAIREEILHRRERDSLEKALLLNFQFQGMVGSSPAMQSIFTMIRRVARHDATVLITGATGTGKELASRALHALSLRSHKRFVACNCSALVESLLESELFGHVKGAFTGAFDNKTGLFEYAHGGTIFLDEIGDLSLPMQAKLLRVLQERHIQRVGSPEVVAVDVRVIAATNRDPRTMVAEKQFREDLYYRLSMVEIQLPRLAERKEDLPLLERHFVEFFAAKYKKPIRGISRRAQALLARYLWPGNVRELENVLGNACIMVEGDTIDVCDLPERLHAQAHQGITEDEELLPLNELQRRHVQRVLARVGGNKAQAAEILHVSRSTLYRLLAESGTTDES